MVLQDVVSLREILKTQGKDVVLKKIKELMQTVLPTLG